MSKANVSLSYINQFNYLRLEIFNVKSNVITSSLFPDDHRKRKYRIALFLVQHSIDHITWIFELNNQSRSAAEEWQFLFEFPINSLAYIYNELEIVDNLTNIREEEDNSFWRHVRRTMNNNGSRFLSNLDGLHLLTRLMKSISFFRCRNDKERFLEHKLPKVSTCLCECV